jgi:DNA sulfur modification protein DndE
VCHGAEKAIFIRGLPEMPISDIHLKDITIKAKKAGDCIVGSNISMTNVRLITEDDGKINVQDSKQVSMK